MIGNCKCNLNFGASTPFPQNYMITPTTVERNLRSNRKEISALAYQTQNQTICKQLQGESPQDCHIINFPRTFDLHDLIMQITTKPIQIEGEQLFFQDVDGDLVILSNDFNRKIARAVIRVIEDKKVLILVGVKLELRKGTYKEVCTHLANQLIEEFKLREQSVVFKGAKVGFTQRMQPRKPTQFLCICLSRVDVEKLDKPYEQQSLQMLKTIYSVTQCYSKCYTAFAFANLTKVAQEQLNLTYFYLDKVNILDNQDENLENSYPLDKMYEIFLFNLDDEEVGHVSLKDASDIKKLNMELHQHLIGVPYLRPTSDAMRFFDFSDDRKMSIDGISINYIQRQQNKYNKRMSCLLLTVTEIDQVKQAQAICQQYDCYLVISTSVDASQFKQITLIGDLPPIVQKAKFVYSDSGSAHYLDSIADVIPLARRHHLQMTMQNDETPDELEPDEALLPELLINQNEVRFRGYTLKYLQRCQQYKENQNAAVCFIDSTAPDFEYQLECAYVFSVKCPEIYMMMILRGVESELYLKQRQTRTTLLNRMNVLAYKSGFIRFLRKQEPELSAMIFVYDQQLKLYARHFSIPEAVKNYKQILEDITNQPLYNERKSVRCFFPKTPQEGQFVFQGQILKLVSMAKPYLNQAVVSLFFIQAPRNQKGDVVVQEVNYDLLQALDVQKSGKSYVLVVVEGLTTTNVVAWKKQFPLLNSLNVLTDKDVIQKARYVNKLQEPISNKFYFVVDQMGNLTHGFSMSSMLKPFIEKHENAGNFLQDESSTTESVVYNDHVFQYLQKVKAKEPEQSSCLIYLNVDKKMDLAYNSQKITALQAKYASEVKFDIALFDVSPQKYNEKDYKDIYYFNYFNIVADTPHTGNEINREEFSYYFINSSLEEISSGKDLQNLENDIKTYYKITQPRKSYYDIESTDNDKSLIIKGFYVPYIRHVYQKSLQKKLALVYMNHNDDAAFAQQLKILDDIQSKYTEIYITLMIMQINHDSYINYVEQYPILNKFNIVMNKFDLAEDQFGVTGANIIIRLEDQTLPFQDILKFQQNLQVKYGEKQIPPKFELVFKAQKCQFIQQVHEKHRKQVPLICCLPKDDFTVSRIQQLYQLQVMYPEVYFVYYIEQTDQVSIQNLKSQIFKYEHLNIVKNVMETSKGLQFYLLNSKAESKGNPIRSIQQLRQELHNLQKDLNQNRYQIVPSLDCSVEKRINYFGHSLEYFNKKQKKSDENVGIVIAYLDPRQPQVDVEYEKLNNMRKEMQTRNYFFVVSLRQCSFDEAKNYIYSNKNLQEMNVVQSIPEAIAQGTLENKYELHYNYSFGPQQCRLYKSVEELAREMKDGYKSEEDGSEEECYLDQFKGDQEMFVDDANQDQIIFRGVKLRMLQIVEKCKKNDSIAFVYIDNVDDEVALEHRLAIVYEMQRAYTIDHYFIVCIRGVKDAVHISNLPYAYFLKRLNVARYRSGLSRMITGSEKEKKLCIFYFSQKFDNTKLQMTFQPLKLDEDLVLKKEKSKYLEDIQINTPSEQNVVVQGFKHTFIQKVTDYVLKYRYILMIYCTMEALKSQSSQILDLMQSRDDLYVMVCIQNVTETQTIQAKPLGIDVNILDDRRDICKKVMRWYEKDYQDFVRDMKDDYEKLNLRYKVLSQMEDELKATLPKDSKDYSKEDAEKLSQFYDDYGIIRQPQEPKVPSLNMISMIFDSQIRINPSVRFILPSVKQFQQEYCMCKKQLNEEKRKIPGSVLSFKHNSTNYDFLFIQKALSNVKQKDFQLFFLDPNAPTFGLDASNIYTIQTQSPTTMIAICLLGLQQLAQQHYTLAHTLPLMNILQDQQTKFDKKHGYFLQFQMTGDFICDGTLEKLATSKFKSILEKALDKTDIKGDKQVLFMGSMYNYLRKILFKPSNNSGLFVFTSRAHDKFGDICQMVSDMATKYPDCAVILFIQDLQKFELQGILDKYKCLYNVNLGMDRNKLCINMIAKFGTGVSICAYSNGKDKWEEDFTKLEVMITGMSFKPIQAKQDDSKLVLKMDNKDPKAPKEKVEFEFKFIQKLYNRRGQSNNINSNQRVCLCLIPNDKQYYNDQMIYYTMQLQVRYPEIYFIVCILGLNKDNIGDYMDRFIYMERLNLVECPLAENLIHECDQTDVDEEGLPADSLGKKIYTFKMFNGGCKEDLAVQGTPQDEIIAEFVTDKFSTREHYRYLAPTLDVQQEKFGFKGLTLTYLNRASNQKYDRFKMILYVRMQYNDKVDQMIKYFYELQRQKTNVYLVVSIDKVNKETIKSMLQQKPLCKNMNIVTNPVYDDAYPISFKNAQDKIENFDFAATLQLPNFTVYENLYQTLQCNESGIILSQKVGRIQQFIEVNEKEMAEQQKQGEQDLLNLDTTPPEPHEPKEGEEELGKCDQKYAYYDQLIIAEENVIFRCFELNYLQKCPDFEEFQKKEKYCIVTLSLNSLYDVQLFELQVKDIYDAMQSQNIGYMLLIENLFDNIQLYALSQSTHFLGKMTVLQYKLGLNQSLRAAGELVCDRTLSKETLFASTNHFYYVSTPPQEGVEPQKQVCCQPIMHSDITQFDYNADKSNNNGCLLLNTPNQNYLVLLGAQIEIIHKPEVPVQAVSNKLFIVLKEENPTFIDALTDKLIEDKKTLCDVYILCHGINKTNVNGFCKKYNLTKTAYVLNDSAGCVARLSNYAKKIYKLTGETLLMIKMMQEETVMHLTDNIEDISYEKISYQSPARKEDDWWTQENQTTVDI